MNRGLDDADTRRVKTAVVALPGEQLRLGRQAFAAAPRGVATPSRDYGFLLNRRPRIRDTAGRYRFGS
jgi:hypothetical protein